MMKKAFVLGAGLGTRLRPLTDQLPKPLIPVFHRPLITYAFDHLLAAGVREFIVNTHHLPGAYAAAFPESSYKGSPIAFRHEPVLLETAGGIANIADLIGDDSLIVYNGDILTDLPLAPLLAEHSRGENIATLVLRSQGPGQNIGLGDGGRITDIRNKLGSGNPGTHQFTGIYALRADFLQHLTPGKIESVIPIFLDLIQQGARIGSVTADEGQWWDLGDRESYFEAHHRMIALQGVFPAYAPLFPQAVQEGARIHETATLSGLNVIPCDAEVAADTWLKDCILWPSAKVASGARLERCIVLSHETGRGEQMNSVV